MNERQIPLTGDEVRAILAGTKTQMRRIVKNPDWHGCLTGDCPHESKADCAADLEADCPLGQPGDMLWVREAWWTHGRITDRMLRDGADTWPRWRDGGLLYDADLSDTERDEWRERGWRRKPSIHMPRWASRLSLRIKSVRVERVQEISEEDARAELEWGARDNEGYYHGGGGFYSGIAKSAFKHCWGLLYGKEVGDGCGAWKRNDWVWVVGFEVRK